jgi:RimJ/RimL family protein N-acetyltransferase
VGQRIRVRRRSSGAGLDHGDHRPRCIGSNIDPRNTASARVAQKLGAVPEGTTDWAGVTLDVWTYYP